MERKAKMLVCELPIGGYYQTNINNGWDFVEVLICIATARMEQI